MAAPASEAKEVKEQPKEPVMKEAVKEAKEVKEALKEPAKEETKSPQRKPTAKDTGKEVKEEEPVLEAPPEVETEEEVEKKERFQELQVFLKKYNKRFPENIMVKDLEKIIQLRAQDPTKKDIEGYIKKYAKYDREPDGLIENKSLFEILEERTKAPDTPEELKKAFLVLADADGKLLKEELRYHLRTMGEALEEKEVKRLLELASDPNDEKCINIDTFIETIFKAKVIKTTKK